MSASAKISLPRVGRVILNAPLGRHSRIDIGSPATPLRRVRDNAPYLGKAGFSLVEMIGVMAIMAILATVMVPNILKSIERTAVRAEAETLHSLGEQAKLYLRDNRVVPNSAFTDAPTSATSWDTQLSTYSSLSTPNVLTNPRGEQRRYVVETAAAAGLPQRALLISSMRSGLALPTAAVIRTNFVGIWDWNYTAGTPQPPGFPAGTWATMANDFLVIERISFRSLDSDAVRAESELLVQFGEYAKEYLKANGVVPNSAATVAPTVATSWDTQLSAYSAFNVANVLTNPRGQQRRYVVENGATLGIPQRALLVSSMRPGVVLPTATVIRNNFAGIWDWTYSAGIPQPPGFPAGTWSTIADKFLVIERVNFGAAELEAMKKETEVVRQLGEQAKLYLRDYGASPNSAFSNPPTSATSWDTQLQPYASLGLAQILANPCGEQRRYVVENIANPQRALLISSMRAGTALPTATIIRSNFAGIWNWSYSAGTPQPPGFPATPWSTLARDVLVIGRINFTDLRAFAFTMRNNGSAAASYQLLRRGAVVANGPVAAGVTMPVPAPVYPNDQIRLYTAAPATLNLDYVVSTTGKTFVFDGTTWTLE